MGSEGIDVLHVDDEPAFAELVEQKLERRRDDMAVTTATSAEAGLDVLSEIAIDCVVSDYEMPGTDGLEFLEAVRERHPEMPFILFTGEGSETIASEALSAGADSYLPKNSHGDQYDLLEKRIENLVTGRRAETSYREVFDKTAVAMSIRDPETGVFIDVNQQYCDLMGYSREELLSQRGEAVGLGEVPYTTERAHELLRETVESGPQTVEWVNERGDGSAVHIEATLKPAEINGKTRILVSVRDITDQKRREAELERKNDLFAKAQRIARVGGWELEVASGNLRWTEQARRIHGVSPDFDATLESALEFYHPEDREDLRKAVEGTIETGEPFDIEARVRRTDDEICWIRARGDLGYDTDGNALLRGTIQDIDEGKRRERRLRELQYRTRELMRAETPRDIAEIAAETAGEALEMPLSGVHLHDGQGTLRGVEMTEELAEHFESPPDYGRGDGEISGLVWSVFESGDPVVIEDTHDRPEFSSESSIARSGIVHPLGDHGVFITSSPAPEGFDESDEALAEMLAATTTAALDRAERERRYDAIFNKTFQFTGLMKPDGTLIEANETALEFGGIDRDDVVGKPIWETHWFQESEETRGMAREAAERAADGEFVRKDVPVRGADRTAIIDFSVRPVTDQHGNVVLLVPEGRDITELKEKQAELERTNEQLEEFAQVVSHDLRSPLSVASGRLELLARECDSEHVEAIDRAHGRMQALIEDLLTLARQGQSVDATEQVDLDELARSAWSTVDTGTAELELVDDATLTADVSRAKQLFENLFRNSAEHAGSTPTVRVGPMTDGFYVEDDGPGIPAADREQVFEAGHSLSDGGSGFGLSIVQRIAEAHGWSIRATESDDGGARFEITGVEISNRDA